MKKDGHKQQIQEDEQQLFKAAERAREVLKTIQERENEYELRTLTKKVSAA